MSHLILIRHSTPNIIRDLPANKWHLSDAGRERSKLLALHLERFAPTKIYSSVEPKAVETAAILAGALDVPYESAPNLHEHKREKEIWTTSEIFRANVEYFFQNPDTIVFGEESAGQAAARFRQGVEELVPKHPDQTFAAVTHGTVMTLFICLWNDIDAYQFWSSLEMPTMAILSLPDFELKSVIAL